ncbi:MAG: hypothetical protein GY822_20950 [Deltaproteobacteria bacterium]|nr:hypothetical protein [Deltaproteobacteria bacterium]
MGIDETKERAGNEKSRDAVQKICASIPSTRATMSGSSTHFLGTSTSISSFQKGQSQQQQPTARESNEQRERDGGDQKQLTSALRLGASIPDPSSSISNRTFVILLSPDHRLHSPPPSAQGPRPP